MVDYDIYNATIDDIIPGVQEKGLYKFFLLVNAENGKKYQIKLNESNQRHNINEFIANYIGNCSDMPLLDGAFLYLSDIELNNLKAYLSKNPQLTPVDLTIMKKNFFFGIEWKQHITPIDKEDELLTRVNETSNSQSFYSLYSFDQYLKNFDRHLGNHLVVQERNTKSYHLIDFDRIFASTNWSNLSSPLKNDFVAFSATPYAQPYHHFLMGLVDDTSLMDVLNYTGKIAKIKAEDIKDMCNIITDVYNVSKLESTQIFDWLNDRKGELVLECYKNEIHFPKITKRGLL